MNAITLRAKCTENENGRLVLVPIDAGTDPARTFYAASRAGRLEFSVVQPAALGEFRVGDEYVLTVERAPLPNPSTPTPPTNHNASTIGDRMPGK